MQIRPGAQRVEVYNEGLAVYLHDPANVAAILKAHPKSILEMSNVEPSKDKALKRLVDQGMLVTYFLRQDDSIVVDVYVGPPFDKSELKQTGVPWMKPQQAVISLPSGRLRIDTPNTFRLSEDARLAAEEYEKEHGRPPEDGDLKAYGLEDESGEVSVPPGDYVLTLYRVDFDKMDDEDENEEYDGPGEAIVLTPASEIERPKRIPAVLEYGAGQSRVRGIRHWKIADGAFRGCVCGANIVNLSWLHAERLGLRRGQHLRVTHDGKPYDAVFLGGAAPRERGELVELLYPGKLAALKRERPDLLTAAIHEDTILQTPLLRLNPLNLDIHLEGEPMSEVVIEPREDFILAPPETEPRLPQGEFADAAVRGEVLLAGPDALELSCGPKALKPLLPSKAGALTLTIGDGSAPVLVLPSEEHWHRPWHIVGSADADADFFGKVFAYMHDGGDDVFRACIGEERSKELTKRLKEYKAICKFTPQDGYVPKDPEKAEALRTRCVELWREGVGRLAAPSAMQAVLRTHWDGPRFTTLSCRFIGNKGTMAFAAKAGDQYVLRRLT